MKTYTSRYMWVILVLSAEGSPMLPTFCPCNERQIWASSAVLFESWGCHNCCEWREESCCLVAQSSRNDVYIIYIYIIHKSIHLLLYICIFMFILHVCAGGWFSVRAFLRFFAGWGGVGWGGVGWADNVQWHLQTYVMLRYRPRLLHLHDGVGWGGVGW